MPYIFIRLTGCIKIVPEFSATLGIGPDERVQSIDADHSDMCRFSSAEDNGYKKVVAALERLRKRAETLERKEIESESPRRYQEPSPHDPGS